MIQPVLINGRWRSAVQPVQVFRAKNPRTGKDLGEEYPVSGFEDLQQALRAGRFAAQAMLTCSPEEWADFLWEYAEQIEKISPGLAAAAAQETGLAAAPRFSDTEIPRTTDQLRQAAQAARDRSWCMAVLDTTRNIRSCFRPLGGPVITLGPNNFPLAFNAVSGGDFAAAIAAGNPVIAKAHPLHPRTTQILAETAWTALKQTRLPKSLIQMIYHVLPEDGLRLAAHPDVGALAFTGSRMSGLALKQAADKAGNPIYLEMSGINPVVLLPNALKERNNEIAEELSTSCALGVGQFCTNPGLILLLERPQGLEFIELLARKLEVLQPGYMVSRLALKAWRKALTGLQRYGAEIVSKDREERDKGMASPTLLRVSGQKFITHSDFLQSEAFGPSTLTVLCSSFKEMLEITAKLEGNLTGAIYSHSGSEDDALYEQIEPLLRNKVGRLLNDKPPTGVAVSPAMFHGGPYPSTGHPGFSSVGIPRSLLRFSALQCYDHVRAHRLPPELRDKNPTGSMWRFIDGRWSQDHAVSA